MLYLPWPPSAIRIQSFSLIVGLMGGSAVGLGFLMDGLNLVKALLLVAGFIGLVFALASWRVLSVGMLGYKGFNKVVRLFMVISRWVVLRLFYTVVWVAGGKGGASLRMVPLRNGESNWTVRAGSSSKLSELSPGVIKWESGNSHYCRPMVQWAFQSGNWWMIGLLGFMVLLDLYENDQPASHIPSNLYTLY